MTYSVMGGLAGFAVAVAIALLVPSLGFVGGIFLGFGLSMLGSLVGQAADR